MAQRTVCLCDGKYIGIETIYTVVDGKQINIPEKLQELRGKSRNNELFCPCGCGANLVLVAGDRNLREQHFRLKDGSDESKCHVVTEGKTSIVSKIILKCWLDDKLGVKDLESRVPINAIADTERKYEFTFLTRERNLALIYYYNRLNIEDEKIEVLNANKGDTNILYVVDYSNLGSNGQYPEFLMKIQKAQGYCLALDAREGTYNDAQMYVILWEKDRYGTWDYIWVEDFGILSKYSISKCGELLYRGRPVLEMVREEKEKYEKEIARIIEEEERERRSVEKHRAEEARRNQERAAWIRDYERRQIELEKEKQRRIKEETDRRERLAKEASDFERELPILLLQQEKEVRDPYGTRWIMCSGCGLIAKDNEFISYGGTGSVNLGTCRTCMKAESPAAYSNTDKPIEQKQIISKYDKTICPVCGNALRKRNGKFGEFWGCSNYPECRYTRKIPTQSEDF